MINPSALHKNSLRSYAAGCEEIFFPNSAELLNVETLLESVNTSACINKLLLACVERMALRADFNLNILLCGASIDHIAASAGNSGIIILRMDTFFHFYTSFLNKLI